MDNNLNISVTASLNKQKSVAQINSEIQKIETQLKKLRLQVALDRSKSSSEINKQIESLSKQRKKLYVDLKIRKKSLKNEFKEIQQQANVAMNVDTANAQRQINATTNAVKATKNELRQVFS